MSNKVALFVGHDAIGLEITNQVVSGLVKSGLKPVFYNVCSEKNRKFKTVPLPDLGFYEETLLEEVIFPFIEEYNPDAILKNYDQLSSEHGIEHHKITDINDVKIESEFIGAVSIRFRQIFDKDIITDINKKSGFFWNLHGGLLPEYRGILSAFWAQANNEEEYGWSLHNIARNGKIDAGAVISSQSIPLEHSSSIRRLYVSMVPHGSGIILKSIKDKLSDCSIQETHQSEGMASYYPFPSETQMSEKNIVYCSPLDAVEYYTSRYGGNDINQQEVLRNSLIQKISEYEQSKIKIRNEVHKLG